MPGTVLCSGNVEIKGHSPSLKECMASGIRHANFQSQGVGQIEPRALWLLKRAPTSAWEQEEQTREELEVNRWTRWAKAFQAEGRASAKAHGYEGHGKHPSKLPDNNPICPVLGIACLEQCNQHF